MRSGLLSDNFAFSDTFKDFNDSKLVPKLVLPTGFTPGKGTVEDKPVSKEDQDVLHRRKEDLIISNAPSQEDEAKDRGWRM